MTDHDAAEQAWLDFLNKHDPGWPTSEAFRAGWDAATPAITEKVLRELYGNCWDDISLRAFAREHGIDLDGDGK